MWMIEHGYNTNVFMFMGELGVNGIIVSFRWVMIHREVQTILVFICGKVYVNDGVA
jgi:hypothetical protein